VAVNAVYGYPRLFVGGLSVQYHKLLKVDNECGK